MQNGDHEEAISILDDIQLKTHITSVRLLQKDMQKRL